MGRRFPPQRLSCATAVLAAILAALVLVAGCGDDKAKERREAEQAEAEELQLQAAIPRGGRQGVSVVEPFW